jgi:dihydroxyacetone kinase-like predicted kinase
LEDAPAELIGAWRLASFEDRESEQDEWQQPLGTDAAGVIICDSSGTVSVHIHAPHPLSDDYPS